MIPILYEDSALLVCIKPSGVLSEAGSPGLPGLPNMLRDQVGGEIFPVHRLDRDTGGLMVYAKTREAAAALSASIQKRELHKAYWAVVQGVPPEREGTFRDLLLHDRQRNKSFVVSRPRGGVKEAVLDYRLLASREGRSLVYVRLHTGRTHQIRVQFASRKMPLLGDRKYGGPQGDLALWSRELAFPHPVSHQRLRFSCDPEGRPWTDFSIEP